MEKEKALENWDAIFGMNSYWQVDCFDFNSKEIFK